MSQYNNWESITEIVSRHDYYFDSCHTCNMMYNAGMFDILSKFENKFHTYRMKQEPYFSPCGYVK